MSAASSRLHQGRLYLREPEGYVHSTVQLDSGGRGGTRLLPLPLPGVQCPEATVAVRLERVHAQLFGQGEGLAVVAGGWLDLGGRLAHRTLAQEPQGPGLVAASWYWRARSKACVARARASSMRPASRYASLR